MANTDYANTVPLGQAGTGAAYVLPQSQALSSLNQFIDSGEAERRRQLLLQQQQAKELAAQWQKNQLAIKGGTLFQPEINKRAAEVTQLGVDLYKAGVNPSKVYNDEKTQKLVDAYQQKRAALLSDVDVRDKIALQAKKNEDLLAANPAGFYDQDGVNKYHDYISGNTPLSEISSKGLLMPELQKSFNLKNELIDKIKPVAVETKGLPVNGVETRLVLPNKEAHAKLAATAFESDPRAQAYLEKKIGMPIDSIPATDNVESLKKQRDAFWRSAPNISTLAARGITSFSDPKYGQLLDSEAKKLSMAKKTYDDEVGKVKDYLDDSVRKTNDKSLNFKYEDEMRKRESHGWGRMKFADWLDDQQNEAGDFSIGNQGSYVPVRKTKQAADGGQSNAIIEPEKGASLFGINLPKVNTIVRPEIITDLKTGKTAKNAEPVNVNVSQIQMVPVFKGLSNGDDRNGSEVSARQLREIAEGKSSLAKMNNVTFQPYVYGTQLSKDANGHVVESPVKFSYDALKGSNVKKINVAKFELAKTQLQEALNSPEYKALSTADRYKWLKQTFNIQE